MSQHKYDILRLPHVSLKSIFSKAAFRYHSNDTLSQQPPTKSRRSRLQEKSANLPIEIVQYIFLHAALDPSLRSLTLSLMRVSRWVNDLVRPHLYHSIRLKKRSEAERFLFTITRNLQVCHYIVNLEVPEVKNPYLKYYWWETAGLLPSWKFACGKYSPDYDTLAKIIRILLESKVDQTEQKQTMLHLPLASRLESLTIQSLYFSPPHWTTLERRLEGVRKLFLPPMVTLTSLAHLVIGGGIWDFTLVKKLRFTSIWMDTESYITQFLSLPQLTHLALRLQTNNAAEKANLLLTSPQLQKLVVFSWYGPKSTIVPNRISNIYGPDRSPEEVHYFPHFVPDRDEIWANSETLGDILDDRLFLFDYYEMEKTYEMSNEDFWSAIDKL